MVNRQWIAAFGFLHAAFAVPSLVVLSYDTPLRGDRSLIVQTQSLSSP